jgi:hypothetical protein
LSCEEAQRTDFKDKKDKEIMSIITEGPGLMLPHNFNRPLKTMITHTCISMYNMPKIMTHNTHTHRATAPMDSKNVHTTNVTFIQLIPQPLPITKDV